MRIILLTFALAISALSQVVVNMPNSVTVSASATDALNKWLPTQITGVTTTLNGAISSGATSIVLTSGTGIGANDAFIIDSEVFACSAKATSTFTCAGAQFGTTAAAHSSGAVVSQLKWPTFRSFFIQGCINGTVASIMDQLGTAKDIYATAVTNAKSTLDSAKSTAVQ